MKRPQANHVTGFLWAEEGEAREGAVAEVAPILRVDRTYTFAVPEELAADLTPGRRVMVPLGRKGRLVEGFVVSLDRKPWDSTLRPIHSLIDADSFLSPDLVELGRQISEHYCCPLGKTLKAITPEAVRKRRGIARIRFALLVGDEAAFRESGKRLTSQRRAIMEALAGETEPMRVTDLLAKSDASPATLRTMEKQGMVQIIVREDWNEPQPVDSPIGLSEPEFELNDEQDAALASILQSIDAGAFDVTLLFGVSGAGKTEVYVHAIRRIVERGRQAILLVPEIVLTTQLANRLAARFANVAVQHSGLTETQRSVMWRQIAAGQRSVVIGTRSAVYSPCPNLGLIVVDEEQETGYKNLQAPRFHVRDVAIMRAKQQGIPVVLGSATPSLETWHKSNHREDYRRVEITRRVRDLPMPRVHVVDMRDEIVERKKNVVLSRLMERLLDQTLERGEQAMILMNRRGFANRVFCPGCKTRLTCPNCNVGLVVHTTTGQSICHYCRTRIPTPTHCPNVTCGEKLIHVGAGTQRIEQTLVDRYPEARIHRVDSDTMRHRSQYEQMVSDFEARKIDILIGTQMIAKGLDFPFVSFVAMIQTDGGGLSADFRAHERLFQLITQVAGRAGRADAPGQVVVQTLTPELPALRFAIRHDYPAFAEQELGVRRQVGFPPFRRLARFVLSHPREGIARREGEALVVRLHTAIETLRLEQSDVLDPNPCPISRLRGRYRFDVVVRTPTATTLRRLLDRLQADRALRAKSAELIVDVDPVSMA